jgi:hypothetical protein
MVVFSSGRGRAWWRDRHTKKNLEGGIIMKKYFVMVVVIAMAVVLGCTVAALAADKAEKGKKYEITIAEEDSNPFIGDFGIAKIGTTDVLIGNSKKDEKFKIEVTSIGNNVYTGNDQVSCTYEEIGGKGRKGSCIPAP